MKRCPQCDQHLPAEAFSLDRNRPHRLTVWCRSCASRKAAEYRARRRATDPQYVERIRSGCRQWREQNREKMRAAVVDWQRRNREYFRQYRSQAEERWKEEARAAVREAMRSGALVKPDACSSCGRVASGRYLQAHHHDYSRPLEVRWLCSMCHSAEHRKAS